MQIGIHAPLYPADADLVRDLGVTATKFGADVGGEPGEEQIPDIDRHFDLADELGLSCVVDLRTSQQYMFERAMETQIALTQAGDPRLLRSTPETTEDERKAIAEGNHALVHLEAYKPLLANVTATVARYANRCSEWEFWGESNCPYVAGPAFRNTYTTYSGILRLVCAAIKAGNPAARVWTGGNGMDLELGCYRGLLNDGAGQAFDVCNLHPYFTTVRSREVADYRLETGLTELREDLNTRGLGQPYAATEWGYPTHSVTASAPEIETYLFSNVCVNGYRQLGWSEARLWYEADLAAFERFGFETVIVHSLRDTPKGNPFWGDLCGLVDVEGRRKSAYEVVQRWAWKGRD